MKALFTLKKTYLLWILFVGILVRLMLSHIPPSGWGDTPAFFQSAWALLNNDMSLWHNSRAPGFPMWIAAHAWLLSWIKSGVSVPEMLSLLNLENKIVGCLTAVFSAEVAYRLFGRPRAALLTGLLVAISPGLNHYEYHTNCESLYTFFFVLFCYVLLRWLPTKAETLTSDCAVNGGGAPPLSAGIVRLIGVGLFAAWLVYLKVMALLVVLLPLVVFLLLRRQIRQAAVLSVAVSISVFCWMNVMHQAFGVYQFMAGGGIHQLYKVIHRVELSSRDTSEIAEFKQGLLIQAAKYPPELKYEAVNDYFRIMRDLDGGRHPESVIYNHYIDLASRVSGEVIRRDPLYYLQVTWHELWVMLFDSAPWDPYRFYGLPILLLGFAGMWRAYRQLAPHPRAFLHHPAFLMMLFILCNILIYPVINVMLARYRLPVEPLLAAFATYWLAERCGCSRKTAQLTLR